MCKLSLLVLVAGLVGCSHTKSVTPAQADESAPKEKRAEAEPYSARGDRDRPRPAPRPSSAVPLATSAAGLLQPGAAAAVQDKLIERGLLDRSDRSEKLDGKTEKALRDFQREQGLPATGTPDDLTVRKLGLDPSGVFRSSHEEGK